LRWKKTGHMRRMKVKTPTIAAVIHAQYQREPVVLFTLETPLGKPKPEIFWFEQEVSSRVLAEIAKSPRIRRLRRMGEE
jgi:hypothetical protein